MKGARRAMDAVRCERAEWRRRVLRLPLPLCDPAEGAASLDTGALTQRGGPEIGITQRRALPHTYRPCRTADRRAGRWYSAREAAGCNVSPREGCPGLARGGTCLSRVDTHSAQITLRGSQSVGSSGCRAALAPSAGSSATVAGSRSTSREWNRANRQASSSAA